MTKAAALYVFCGLIVFLFVFNTWQNYLSYSKASTCFVINPIHLIWEALREWKAPCWQTENWLWIPDLLRVTSMDITLNPRVEGKTNDHIRPIISLMWSSGITSSFPLRSPIVANVRSSLNDQSFFVEYGMRCCLNICEREEVSQPPWKVNLKMMVLKTLCHL